MLFRHLKSFCAVADEGHVTRAAKRLNMAQPGLTQHIKALEEVVGVELVQRAGRGIELTPSGHFLHDAAAELLENLHIVLEKTREVAGVRKGRIEVGVTGVVSLEPSVTRHLLEFRRLYPEIIVRDAVLEAEQAFQLLRQKRIDVIFSCGSVPKSSATMKRTLGPITTALAVSRFHRLADRSHTTLRELCADTLIIVSPCVNTAAVKERMRRLCAQQGLAPKELHITSDLFSALSQVSSNTGVAIVPESIRTLKTDAVQYLPLSDVPQSLLTLALYIRRNEQSRNVLTFSGMS